MINDYTQEVGLPSHKKTLPRPVAFIILAIVAIGVSFGVVRVVAEAKEQHATEKAAAEPAPAPANATVPVAPEPAK